MKILYFSNDYCTHDHRFLSSMVESGHQVFHVQLEGVRRQVEDRPVPPGVEIVRWAGGRKDFRWRDVPRYVLSLRQVIRRIQPDLIHAGPIQTCALLAVLSGFRPLLTMSWGFDLMEYIHRGRWWQAVTRFVLKRSTFFTSDANVTRDTAVQYGMNPEHTVVFPWGVDLSKFTPKAWEPAPSETFTVFCNRSWEERYGVDVLAQAFVKVAQTRNDAHLLLLGGGSQAQKLRRILQNGGVIDRVTFAGQIPQKDLPRYYHMADLYVSPSHVDGSSVSLLEALACGLPCLVSDIPANKEWVIPDENGWLFRDGHVDQLAGSILSAINARHKLPEIGYNARLTAENKADWTKNFKQLLSVYQQLVAYPSSGG